MLGAGGINGSFGVPSTPPGFCGRVDKNGIVKERLEVVWNALFRDVLKMVLGSICAGIVN